jgi:hypothetical protein
MLERCRIAFCLWRSTSAGPPSRSLRHASLRSCVLTDPKNASGPPRSRSAWRRYGGLWRVQGFGIHRADKGDDLPEIVTGLDDIAERRHWTGHPLVSDTLIALLLQLIGAFSDAFPFSICLGASSSASAPHAPTPMLTTIVAAMHR